MAAPTLSQALANVDGDTGVPTSELEALQYLTLFTREALNLTDEAIEAAE